MTAVADAEIIASLRAQLNAVEIERDALRDRVSPVVDELEAFEAYVRAHPMATYWNTWQARAVLATNEALRTDAARFRAMIHIFAAECEMTYDAAMEKALASLADEIPKRGIDMAALVAQP